MNFINSDFVYKYIKKNKLTKQQADRLINISDDELCRKLSLDDLEFLKDMFKLAEFAYKHILDLLVSNFIKE